MEIITEIFTWIGLISLALLMFSLSVAAHEFGHLLFAKWRGMVVEKFAIGFGPVLWKKDWAGIEWSLRPFPLGGFVALPQMATMEAVEGKTDQPAPQYPPAKPLDKIIAAFGGPLFSFLFGLSIACLVWVVGKPEPDAAATTIVGYVVPDSPAATAESPILPGDKILFIDNKEVTSFSATSDNIIEAIILSTGETIQFDIHRETRTEGVELITTDITPQRDEIFNVRRVGISPATAVIIGQIAPGSPAERAGLKPGDRILEANFAPVYSPEQFIDIVNKSGGQQLTLQLQRGEEQLTIVAFPEFEQENERYMLGFGFAPAPLSIVHIPPMDLVMRSMIMIKRTVGALSNPQSDIKAEHLSGPVGIISNQARLARQDIRLLFWFLVILNINLAILNLLPLPVLDGGHIVFSLIEWVMRRPLPLRLVESLQTVFALLLIGFMLYVTFHDSVREFKIFRQGQEAESNSRPIESLRFPEIQRTPEDVVHQPQ